MNKIKGINCKIKGITFKSFKEACKYFGVNYLTACKFKERNPDLTLEEIIEHYLSNEKTFIEECKNKGLNVNSVNCYFRRHPEYKGLSNKEKIDLYIYGRDNFHKKCINNGVKYNTAFNYKKLHPELSEDEVIEYYLKKRG